MLGTTASALAQTPGDAESYPSSTVTLVVPFSAGGGVDIVGRILGQALSKELGQSVVVENKPGASGMIGAAAVASAKPDGLTLLLASSGESAINPHLYKNMSYDPAKDLAPVSLIAKIPNLVTASTQLPFNNPKELVEYAQKHDKQMTYSSAGVGNIQNISGELLNKLLGTHILHIPYKGSAQALADVTGGQVSFTFSSAAAALPYLQAGKVKAVGVTSERPMKNFPDVMPLSSAPELADFILVNWFGLFATAGTPDPIIEKVNQAVVRSLNDPKVVQALEAQGAEPTPMTPAEFGKFREQQSELFGNIIKDAGIKLD
ncbi:tripartite tricarboxylate transporter substrate binding protein [Alcaligenaceae bacterium]|nr:tripartite tricarboxylate transporter substrate binding protein [Alcaligenaceae bacterium]